LGSQRVAAILAALGREALRDPRASGPLLVSLPLQLPHPLRLPDQHADDQELYDDGSNSHETGQEGYSPGRERKREPHGKKEILAWRPPLAEQCATDRMPLAHATVIVRPMPCLE
jgi:hypothetical protein